MLLRGGERRIFAWSEPVDMRKSFNGLIALTRDVLKEDPLSGDMYVFTNRGGNLLKCLMWDRTGYMVIAKRLEGGRFRIPGVGTKREMNDRVLQLVLDGIPLGITQ